MRPLLAALLLTLAPGANAAPALPAGARMGVLVVDAQGAVIAEARADERMVPASTTKLFTTAAALALLGDVTVPDSAGGASVALQGPSRHPDVVLAGHGDARLSSAADCMVDCLATLADAVAARTRQVRDVVGDDRAMADERWPSGMSRDNVTTPSGTAVSALTLDDNLVAVPGGRARAVEDPADRAAQVFAAMLVARGVTITGGPVARHRIEGEEAEEPPVPLARLAPPPLAEDIALTLRQSQNLHAELLLRRLAPDGSVAAGRTARMAALAAAGFAEGAVSLHDGSGMSTYNRVTPRALVQLLRWGAAQSWAPLWRAGLPVAGRDGTLKARLRGTPLEGRLAAKTGTLAGTQALAGFLTAASGRELTFAVLVNDLPDGTSATAAVDALLLDLAARN